MGKVPPQLKKYLFKKGEVHRKRVTKSKGIPGDKPTGLRSLIAEMTKQKEELKRVKAILRKQGMTVEQ